MATAYKYQDEVLNIHGDVVPFAVVTVYVAGTSTLATLYANTASTIPLANPVTADYQGYFFFYAANGTYDLQVTGTGITSRVLTDVFLGVGTTLPGISIVDGIINTTIQSAITAASTTGSVLIPSNYAGTDVYTNPNKIQILDLRGKPDRSRGFINMLVDCGLKGDGVTDDSTAANACFVAYPGREFYFPKTQANGTCSYLFGATLTPQGVGAVVRGDAGGGFATNFGTHFGGTELCFTPGVTGFLLDNVNASVRLENLSINGQNGTGSQGTATLLNLPPVSPIYTRTISSIQRTAQVLTVTVTSAGLEGLTAQVGSTLSIAGVVGDATMNGLCTVASLSNSTTNPFTFTCSQQGADSGPFGAVGTVSPYTTGTSTADGVRICGNFHSIQHITVGNFGRHGINGASNETGCVSAFSDDLIVRDSTLYNNQGHGIFMRGVDSNAGLFDGNALYYNGLWGGYDSSFLGNTWIANQASYNGISNASGTAPTTKVINAISRTTSTVSVTLASADANIKVGSAVFIAGVTDTSFNTPAGSAFFVTQVTDSTHYQYIQPGAPVDASSSGGTSRMAKFSEANLASGVDQGSYKIGVNASVWGMSFISNYVEGGQACKFGHSVLIFDGGLSCVPNNGADFAGQWIAQGVTGLPGVMASNLQTFTDTKDNPFGYTLRFRAGLHGGTTRPIGFNFLDNATSLGGWSFQVDPTNGAGSGASGSWIFARGGAGGGGVRRLVMLGPTNSNGYTRLNSESTSAVQINNDANSGTGGFLVASGGASPSTVATVDSSGLGTFNGGLKAGASGSTVADTRELLQSAHSCGTTTTCANTTNGSNKVIFGSVALASASPSTATVTGISPTFTSSSSYFCIGTNVTTQANPIKIANVSSSSFTITGPNTVTDVINYICVGN